MAENATDFSSERANAPVAIVTGAAGDIGRAVAMRLHRTGFCVMACDLDVHALRGAWDAATPGSAPARLRFMACDVAHPASVQATVAETLAAWGRIDALVNNAATVTSSAPVCELPMADWQRTLDVNLTGAWLMACAVMPAMTKARRGVILNMSSQLGQVGVRGRGAYGVSKAALLALTRAIAVDYADHGVRAVSLSPGAVLTSRVERRYGSAEKAIATLGPRNLTGRLGTVDEVAEAACFLLSEAAAFITGTDLLMDGGYTAI
jgi:NAD(P)-dependent dehydrogenase (short-subunit alcohol dehydrogenase family)